MAYFADLTRYTYGAERTPWMTEVLNIGWLGAGHPFPTGESPPEFVARVRELALKPVAVTRGFHRCEFCPAPLRDDDYTAIGNGEIRVRGVGRVIYAAPTLIAHYIEMHAYRPPDEFIVAVLNRAQ